MIFENDYVFGPVNSQKLIGPPVDTTQSTGAASGNGGNATDWVLENGDDALDILQQVLCIANPQRPGCPGDPATRPVTVQNGPPAAVYYALAAIVVLLLVILIFKK